jgi:hypothetical protein
VVGAGLFEQAESIKTVNKRAAPIEILCFIKTPVVLYRLKFAVISQHIYFNAG